VCWRAWPAHPAGAAPGTGGRRRMYDLLCLYAQQLTEEPAEADGQQQAATGSARSASLTGRPGAFARDRQDRATTAEPAWLRAGSRLALAGPGTDDCPAVRPAWS
jgi:hypothetical protein